MLFHRQHEGQSHCFWSPFANVTVLVLSIMAEIKPIMKSWNYEIKPIMAEIKPITLCRNFCCLSQHHDVKCQHSTIVGTKLETFWFWSMTRNRMNIQMQRRSYSVKIKTTKVEAGNHSIVANWKTQNMARFNNSFEFKSRLEGIAVNICKHGKNICITL